MKLAVVILAAAAAMAACASTPEPASGPPSLVSLAGTAAPPQARFYADCVAQAAAAQTYDRVGNTIRFICTGAPAQAFYDGLAAWSAAQRAEYDTGDGRTLRFTQRLERDPAGLDYCEAAIAGGGHRCTVVLNVGEFLRS